MSRVQLALRVSDLEGSIAFYSKLFGTEPAKRRPGYANFAIAEPPLKLVLLEGGGEGEGVPTRLDHLGVEVERTADVAAATARLADTGLAGHRPRPRALGGLHRPRRRPARARRRDRRRHGLRRPDRLLRLSAGTSTACRSSFGGR